MFSGSLWAQLPLLQIADFFLRCLQALLNCFPILMAVMTLAVINSLAAIDASLLPVVNGITHTRDSTSHPLGFGTVFLQHGLTMVIIGCITLKSLFHTLLYYQIKASLVR